MISFIRVKNLTVLTKVVPKAEIINVSHFIERNFCTKNVSFSTFIYKQKFNTHAIKNYFHSQSNPKDLGKIVDLDLDFDDVRIDNDVEKKSKKTKKNKKITRGVSTRGNKITKENEISEGEALNFDDYESNDEPNNTWGQKEHLTPDSPAQPRNLNKIEHIKSGYEHLEENSNLFSSIMVKVKSKNVKERPKLITLEGKRLINEAIAAGFTPSKVFFSRISDVEGINLPDTVKLYRVPYKKLKLWSDVVTPQGLVGIFNIDEKQPLNLNTTYIPVTVICDNIRDPGNLGAIMRVVAAVGCEKLILTQGCMDVWGTKVLRAAAGAHFRLPVFKSYTWRDIEYEIHEESKILLADIGFNRDLKASAPLEESEGRSWNISNSNEFSEFIPKYCYHLLQYEPRDTVVIIGGETQGVSDKAYEFALRRKGTKVFIPMSNQIESLNTSVALGILMYEIRRQLLGESDANPTVTDSATPEKGS